MALVFPSQPQTVGTPYEAPNGVTYIWDGVKWNAAGTPGTGNFNLGNLFIIDQTIAGLNETHPVAITGNVTVGNLTTTGLKVSNHSITATNGNLFIDGSIVGQDNTFNQSLNTSSSVEFLHVSASNVDTTGFYLNSHAITVSNGNLFIDGVAPTTSTQLLNGGYALTLYPNGNTVIPGTISSTAAGIPEFNSTTDLNLNAANRVNIVNSPLNLASVFPGNVLGKPGDILLNPALQEIQAYINGAWETLLRTAENQNVRLPQGGAYQRADGVRAAWFTELPTDISQLTDNDNLLASQLITLQNIDIDGGGAYSIYDVGLMFADGGFGSTRFGPSDTVFDGAGAGSGYTNTLNGGGA
jgi:hypothetical protein